MVRVSNYDMAVIHNIRVVRGETAGPLIFGFVLNGVPEDLTGCAFELRIMNALSGAVVLSYTLGNGLSVDLTTAKVTFSQTPEQSALFPLGLYKYKLLQTKPDATLRGRVKGTFEIVD